MRALFGTVGRGHTKCDKVSTVWRKWRFQSSTIHQLFFKRKKKKKNTMQKPSTSVQGWLKTNLSMTCFSNLLCLRSKASPLISGPALGWILLNCTTELTSSLHYTAACCWRCCSGQRGGLTLKVQIKYDFTLHFSHGIFLAKARANDSPGLRVYQEIIQEIKQNLGLTLLGGRVSKPFWQ